MKKQFLYDTRKGFTLIELLIVIAIIAILAGVAFVALNPLGRFQDARDSRRWSDVTALTDAIKVNQVDRGGSYLFAITNAATGTNFIISNATTTTGCNLSCDVTASSSCINLQGFVDQGYLASLPVSPNGTGNWSLTYTGYYLSHATTGSVTIGSCESENTSSISISR